MVALIVSFVVGVFVIASFSREGRGAIGGCLGLIVGVFWATAIGVVVLFSLAWMVDNL